VNFPDEIEKARRINEVNLEFPKKVEGISGFFSISILKDNAFSGKGLFKDEFAYRYLPLSTEYFKMKRN